ncbi:MAG: cytidylate kinase [Crocinitomicaceae bacterium]|nr:cytidylate kinase [Crocinitomicaceae bacterium]|tara:strand:- start:304 stop:1002 length:699 start_codon:yes stop_codon:yes gene_type:complete
MEQQKINIAIDGHSSAGKSTMAKALAKELNFVYVDTGAMYRAATLFCLRERLIESNEIDSKKIEHAVKRMYIGFKYNPKTEQPEVHLGGSNVEEEIRSLEVAKKVSLVAAIPNIRHKLVELQQRMAESGGVIMDGRDIGTVVMPNAKLKFFVTADAQVRARRRVEELKAINPNVKFEEVLKNLVERDRIDSNRAVSPLRQADDAIVLDNSQLTHEEQFQFLLVHARKAMASE